MSEALEWVKFSVDTLFRIVGLSLAIIQGVFLYRIWRWWAFERPAVSRGSTASPKVLARRLFCAHHNVYRSRDQYGKHSTFCLRCNVDVNAGRPQEEWR